MSTKLTVFLVRHGETELETAVALDEAAPEDSASGSFRHHQELDPKLTETGYHQAQQVFTALIQQLCDHTPVPVDRGDGDNDGVIDPLRNLACFAAPLKACLGTAALLTAANMAAQDKLTWRYTTVEAATSPSAVPVIVDNCLGRRVPAVQACGGVNVVVDAGLWHGAAAAWNDARPKCPLMQTVTREFKGVAQDFVKEWNTDRTVDPPRRVLDVQYLRLQHDATLSEEDPWSLENLTPKINLCVDLLEPNMYLTPPRQGQISNKLHVPESVENEEDPLEAVENCVWKARQVGCDTILLTVPAACMERMLEQVGAAAATENNVVTPCSVVTLTALVDDCAGAIMDWQLHGHFPVNALDGVVPEEFPGMVDCLVPPPPDKDPSSVPANQWSKFPPPEPENIPPDYPDLPPFSLCLQSPVPDVKPLPPPPPESVPRPRHEAGTAGPGRGRGRVGGRGPPPSGRGGPIPPSRAPPPGRGAPAARGPGRAPPPGRSGRAPPAPGRAAPPAGRAPPGRPIPPTGGHTSPSQQQQQQPARASAGAPFPNSKQPLGASKPQREEQTAPPEAAPPLSPTQPQLRPPKQSKTHASGKTNLS